MTCDCSRQVRRCLKEKYKPSRVSQLIKATRPTSLSETAKVEASAEGLDDGVLQQWQELNQEVTERLQALEELLEAMEGMAQGPDQASVETKRKFGESPQTGSQSSSRHKKARPEESAVKKDMQ